MLPHAIIQLVLVAFSLFFVLSDAHARLVAFYPLEANTMDESGNENHGTANGGLPFVAGFEGQAGDFDGIDDFIRAELDINPSVLPQVTMGAWVKPEDFPMYPTDSRHIIISHDNGFTDRTLGVQAFPSIPDGWMAFTAAPPDGVVSTYDFDGGTTNWTFIAVVYDQDAHTATLYRDSDATNREHW